jgi:alkylation response protein AidB-like acyl-CoA dehydrogenase
MRLAQLPPLALAGSVAIEAAVQAVDLVHSCAGTSGLRNEQRFQQYFRDVHTISQHAFASPSRFDINSG